MIKYKTLSTVTASIALSLWFVLLFIPEFVLWLFSIEEHASASFIAKRAAMLFLGISVLTWASKHAAHSESRQAICASLAVSMFMLALLGTFEYVSKHAGLGIFLAVSLELILALLYFNIWLKNKNAYQPYSSHY